MLAAYSSLSAEGTLYSVDRSKLGTRSFEKGHLVFRVPLERLTVTDAVLRYDTDDPKILWLELHMTKMRDSGDYSYFEPISKRKQHNQIYTRGSEIHAHGCKWAIRFDSVNDAKRVLGEVQKAYSLSAKHVHNKTT